MSKKILIVDDEKITLRMTDHILSTQYTTFCALSGGEAMAVYKKERPDMILSDLHMPEMSGFELQNTLQDLYAEHIPFMFMTADRSDGIESKGFENGAVDFIHKPFRADVLLRRVENILSNAERIQGLRHAAQTDPMTGLLNKASSQEEIGRMCRESAGTLMMIDLDSFKLVNDLYGHSAGDEILIRLAEIIRAAIRSNDLAGRMGGDEFIVFCQNVNDEEIIARKTEYINRELLQFARELMGEDMTIPLGVSVGAVFVPDEGTDFLTIYRKADKALYQVKQNGKHGYAVFRDRSDREHATEDRLRSEIRDEMQILSERDHGKGAYRLNPEQFRLIYRFLVRMEANYQRTNRFVIFSLDDGSGKKVPDILAERLYEVVCGSLRRSDVVSRPGSNQVMLLLLEAGDMDAELVIQRIQKRWDEEKTGYLLTWEMELIRGN